MASAVAAHALREAFAIQAIRGGNLRRLLGITWT
jgi:hypothetical protein